jgi:hypothetical protein
MYASYFVPSDNKTQGCQIFLETIYQNGGKYTKLPNDHKVYPKAVIYSKWTKNIQSFSNLRPSKIYPNWDFWFENKPSGNPASFADEGRFLVMT